MFGIVLKGEKGDFIIEVKNRRINMWIFIGVLDNKWFNVCMCIDKLEKVYKKKEKIKILFLFFIFFDVFVFIYLCIFIVMFVILKCFVC